MSGDEILQSGGAAKCPRAKSKILPSVGRRHGLFKPRKFSGGHGERRNFSAAKFTRRAKFNAPKRHENLKEKR